MRNVNAILLITVFSCLISCGNANRGTSAKAATSAVITRTLPVPEFESKLSQAKGMQLVDVRSADEYAEGHLKNAVNIDVHAADFAKQISALNKTKPVFVYCASGRRSAHAAEIMEGLGFAEVYNMEGGMNSWENMLKPEVREPQSN